MKARLRRRRIWLAALLLVVAAAAAVGLGRRQWGAGHADYRAAQRALQRRDFERASAHLARCIAAWPDDLSVRLLAARTARRQGDLDAAERHLQVYHERKGPAEPLAREGMLLRLQRGDLTEADALLKACADQPHAGDHPLILEALVEGTLASLLQSFVQEAAQQGRQALLDVAPANKVVDLWFQHYTTAPERAQGFVWRGLIRALARDLPQAKIEFRKALDLDPDHFQARLKLAELLLTEAPAEAAAHLERLRQQRPENNHVRLRLAAARRSLGQLEESSQLLDEVLARDPDNIAALAERSQVALDAAQPADAERWLRRALALAPDAPSLNLLMSRCLQLLGRGEEAQRDQERFRKGN